MLAQDASQRRSRWWSARRWPLAWASVTASTIVRSYVFDGFRFHMTLPRSLREEERDEVRSLLDRPAERDRSFDCCRI